MSSSNHAFFRLTSPLAALAGSDANLDPVPDNHSNGAVSPGRRVCLGLLALSALGLSGCDRPPALKAYGHDVSGAKFGSDFSLKDPTGQTRTLADFKGQVVMMFFGFTQCPDICPTALFRAAEIKRMLGEDAPRLQILFVTIDPERDTPAVLRDYAKAFDANVVPLYGDAEQTRQVAKAYNVYYQKVPTGSSYTMDHSSTTYVYDTQGRIRVLFKHEQPAQECVSDIRQLLAEA